MVQVETTFVIAVCALQNQRLLEGNNRRDVVQALHKQLSVLQGLPFPLSASHAHC
jgi:hypothetical protein